MPESYVLHGTIMNRQLQRTIVDNCLHQWLTFLRNCLSEYIPDLLKKKPIHLFLFWLQGGIYVSKVQPGGPAEGLLHVGDRIAVVNGVSLGDSCEHREAVLCLKGTPPGLVQLVVERFACLPNAAAVTTPLSPLGSSNPEPGPLPNPAHIGLF